jgi:hypothetical protein
VSYELRMSDEIRAWLHNLRGSDPRSAGLVGQALTALIEEGGDLGPPLVAPLASRLTPGDLVAALDDICELKLERVQEALRAASWEPARHPEAPLLEQDDLAALQAESDTFRISKEVLRARCVAAETYLEIDGTDVAAAGQLAEVTAAMRQLLTGGDGLADDLMELAPGWPDAGGVLAFFAVEPAGAALLISVIEGADAVGGDRGRAMAISAEVLRRVRAGRDPGASEWEFADGRAFLGEFFPGSAAEVEAGAAALVAASRSGAEPA